MGTGAGTGAWKAISDVHGCLDELEQLLQQAAYNPDRERLVLLGDYVDRGPKSCAVVARVMELVTRYGAVALGGNHEELFLNWLEGAGETDWYYRPVAGGRATVESYVSPRGLDADEVDKAREWIRVEYFEQIEFLKRLPDWHEEEGHLFVHAGINPHVADWRDSTRQELRWIRDVFHRTVHQQAQTVVFGHTPTMHLREGSGGDVFFGEKIVGIDGGCAYGHRLNCLERTEDAYKVHFVPGPVQDPSKQG